MAGFHEQQLTCPPGQHETRMRPVASAGDRFKTCARISAFYSSTGVDLHILRQLERPKRCSSNFYLLELGWASWMRALAMMKPSMGLIRYWHRYPTPMGTGLEAHCAG